MANIIYMDTQVMHDLSIQITGLDRDFAEISGRISRSLTEVQRVASGQERLIGMVSQLQKNAMSASKWSHKLSTAVTSASDMWDEAERKLAGLTVPTAQAEASVAGGGNAGSDLLQKLDLSRMPGILRPFIWTPEELEKLRDVLRDTIFRTCWNSISFGRATMDPDVWKNEKYNESWLRGSKEEDLFLGLHKKEETSLFGTEYENKGFDKTFTSWVGKSHTSWEISWLPGLFSYEKNSYIGKRYVEIDGGQSLFDFSNKTKPDDKGGQIQSETKWDILALEVGAETGAAAFAEDKTIKIGFGDMLGIKYTEEAIVGDVHAGGGGKFNFGSEGINAYVGGEAMVSAVTGKGMITVSLLGMDVDIGVNGYAGAAGAEGKIGIVDGKWYNQINVADGVGAGFVIAIGPNETGWNFISDRFIDGVNQAGQVVQGTGKVIEEAGKGLQGLGEFVSDLWN